MSRNRRRIGIIAASVAAVTVGLALVTGAASSIAQAAPSPSPSSSVSEKAAPDPGQRAERRAKLKERFGKRGPARIAGRALHSEAVVKRDGKYVTVYTQRGEVTAVDGDSVAVKSEDGFTSTYKVTGDTKVSKERADAKIGDVKSGDTVLVAAVKDGDGKTAKRVFVPKKK